MLSDGGRRGGNDRADLACGGRPARRLRGSVTPSWHGRGHDHQDLNLKKAAYERFGVPSYWVIDPDLEQPSIRAFQLANGEFREAAHAVGDGPLCAERPFAVEIVPARLVAKLRTR